MQYIQTLFNKAISTAIASTVIAERLKYVIDNITSLIYTNVCRGLFENHKLIFSFLIAVNINKKQEVLSELLWNVFIRGPSVFDKSKQPPNPDKGLFTDSAWDLAHYLDITFV